MVEPLRFYPPYPNGLVIHATFFLIIHIFLIIPWNGFWQFFFNPIFGLKQPDFKGKGGFLLMVRGIYPLYPLSGPTTKKGTFLCVCVPLVIIKNFSMFKWFGFFTLFLEKRSFLLSGRAPNHFPQPFKVDWPLKNIIFFAVSFKTNLLFNISAVEKLESIRLGFATHPQEKPGKILLQF